MNELNQYLDKINTQFEVFLNWVTSSPWGYLLFFVLSCILLRIFNDDYFKLENKYLNKIHRFVEKLDEDNIDFVKAYYLIKIYAVLQWILIILSISFGYWVISNVFK